MGANVAGALAATYKVTSTADTAGTCSPQPAPCTLRQAVNSATSGSDTITVPSGHYVLGSPLNITASVTINGTGRANRVSTETTPSGCSRYRRRSRR